jgi:hypothetical protein
MMDYKRGRGKGVPAWTVVAAVLVIVVIIAALALYPRAPTSNTVYCGVLQYVAFPAKSVVGGKTITVTETMTTAIDYTTTTTEGPLGKTYSNSTISTGTSGNVAGVETICKYITASSTSG